MDERLTNACAEFLAVLPESDCSAYKLAQALNAFGLNAAQIQKATEKLPIYHDLQYRGIRLLICAYIKQFCAIFSGDATQFYCEVSVPAPLFLIMAFQQAGDKKIRFSTDALIAQIVLRSFFLYEDPVDEYNSTRRICGLNRMRTKLMEHFDYLIQFGVLCDECLKCGEANSDRVTVLSVSYPKGCGSEQRKLIGSSTEVFLPICCEAMGIEVRSEHKIGALKRYAQLMKLQNHLLELNRRADRVPLKGNSFALAQTVQLTVFDKWDEVLNALSVLNEELVSAPSRHAGKRVYCFYIPFLMPEIDQEFCKHGVTLMGNAAFLHHSDHVSFKLEDMVADWLFGMNVRNDAVAESETIAEEIRESDCCAYLTGMYSFDRWMGPPAVIHAEQLSSKHEMAVFKVNSDFWCECDRFPKDQIETICSLLLGGDG